MGRWMLWGALVGCAAISVAACGEDEASFSDTDGGAGASSGGSGGSGGGGTGGSGTGGSAGNATGGSGGTATGGSAGNATGGTAGSATGGTAGAGGSAGSSTGGSAGTGGAGGTNAGCPATKPPDDTPCTTFGLACCYGAAPEKPIRCVPTAADGGGPYEWQTLNARECCPSGAPQAGQQCNTPGDLKCCYGNSGFFCNQQPNPDAWEAASCN